MLLHELRKNFPKKKAYGSIRTIIFFPCGHVLSLGISVPVAWSPKFTIKNIQIFFLHLYNLLPFLLIDSYSGFEYAICYIN